LAQIVIATEDEKLRESLSSRLLAMGYSVGFASTWRRLVESLARAPARLALLDGRAPHLSGDEDRGKLLQQLARSLQHKPHLFVAAGSIPPLPELPTQVAALRRLVSQHVGPAVPREELRLLRLLGVGLRPLQVLAKLARASLPVCLQGERGAGKMQVAQALHRLGGGGPFVPLKAPSSAHFLESDNHGGGELAPVGSRGTLYLALQANWTLENVQDVAQRAPQRGWRVVAGTRTALPTGSGQWTHLLLQPLRVRQEDLHKLTLYYVDLHRKRLGLPRRRLGKGLWALVHAHQWAGNARELESFVATMLPAVDRGLILPRHLPNAVRELVDPRADAALTGEAAVFEDVVESPIRRVVELYEPGGDQSLHELVLGGAERPLIRAVLARTGGNRKAAAKLLGISRNTLQAHMRKLEMG